MCILAYLDPMYQSYVSVGTVQPCQQEFLQVQWPCEQEGMGDIQSSKSAILMCIPSLSGCGCGSWS